MSRRATINIVPHITMSIDSSYAILTFTKRKDALVALECIRERVLSHNESGCRLSFIPEFDGALIDLSSA